MRSFRLFCLLLVSLSLAGISVAQSTSLQAALSRGPDGRVRVTLTNTYTSAARAYIVECDYPGASGTLTHMVGHEGLGEPPYTILADKSQLIGCPLNTQAVEVKVVAYDDGKAEGDPQSIIRITAERQLEAQDVAEDIKILQNALPSMQAPNIKESLNSLIQQFITRAQQHANTAFSPTPQDFVCSWIARGLIGPIHKQPLATLVRGQIAELQKFAAALPKPTQTGAN